MNSLLEVNGVSVSFDGYKAVNELSFEIGEGELRAIHLRQFRMTIR